MIISGYNIKLHRLKTEDDIELLRKWRNTTHINQFMEFREIITKEQQSVWFQSINNINNNYMIIEYEGKKIGLINGAGIDWDKKTTASGGIFIWDESYWMTKAPISASILMTDMSSIYGLEKTYIKILKDNKNAIEFNKYLGYEILIDQKKSTNQHYVLQQNKYELRRKKIFKTLLPEFYLNKVNITFDLDDKVDFFYFKKSKRKTQTINQVVITCKES